MNGNPHGYRARLSSYLPKQIFGMLPVNDKARAWERPVKASQRMEK
ncbi:MAG TPA: hypothetical protein VEY10_14840 [Flavisolibacter sp.]|nr:hypothetical protein [Flavisolibacter sp.]